MLFEILEPIGIISNKGDSKLEVNIISWNHEPPKIDIREWTANHETAKRGLTLSREDAEKLKDILQEYFK